MNANDQFNDMMEAARKMQKNMEEAQEQLNAREETGEAAEGAVTFTFNGHHTPLRLHIADHLQGTDLRLLETWILSAATEATQKVINASQETIINLTKEIHLPGGLTNSLEKNSSDACDVSNKLIANEEALQGKA